MTAQFTIICIFEDNKDINL